MDGVPQKEEAPPTSPRGGGGGGGHGHFSQIQSRRFRRGTSLPCRALCPSMDLIAIGTRCRDDHHHGSGGGAGGLGGGGGGVEAAETIAVHRILSWQGLLTLKAERLSSSATDEDGEDDGVWCVEDLERQSSNNDDDDAESSLNDEDEIRGATGACWSPDGRRLAVGLADGGVAIHTVEPDAASGDAGGGGGDGDGHGPLRVLKPPPPSLMPSSSPSGGVGGRGVMFSPRVTRSMAAAREGGPAKPVGRAAGRSRSRSRSQSPGKRRRGGNICPNAIVGMAWSRLAPRAAVDDAERERREAWRYGGGLVERGPRFLPPGTYPAANNDRSSAEEGLTALCVATPRELHWYLQGRYRLLTVPHGLGACSNGVELAASPDLSTLLAVAQPAQATHPSSPRKAKRAPKATKAKLFGTALLPQKRHDLRLLASAYTSIFAHLRTAQTGIEASLRAWTAAVRPLDAKFRGFRDLLQRYGPGGGQSAPGPDAVRRELLKFVLAGGSTVASDTSGALDQFFTRATMHDQLLTREIRTIEAGAASTETALRGKVLGALRAAVYETEELYGLASAQSDTEGEGLVDPAAALRLHASARVLYLTFEQCLGYVVQARARLHDLLAWMRGAAARVRARGTAADGVQRRNARDRRASDGVVRRVASFLSGPMACASPEGDGERRTLTECVIGVPLSDFLVEGGGASPSGKGGPPPPHGTKRVRSLAAGVRSTFRLCAFVFDRPRGVLARSLDETDLCFEEPHSVIALHTRIGAGPNARSDDREGGANGFFVPKLYRKDGSDDEGARLVQPETAETDRSIKESPFWMLLARSTGEVGYGTVELIAIPGPRGTPEPNGGFYLRAELRLPDCAEVASLAFYGDDGISSLSPNLGDDAEAKEGRQSLGMVVRPNDLGKRLGMRDEELWVFPYDEVAFRKVEFRKSAKNEVAVPAVAFSNGEASFVCLSDEEIYSGCPYTVPKRRPLTTHRKNSQLQQQPASQVDLCGSRGTGGVVAFGASTFLTIFDLEEDEEDGASSDGDEEEAGFDEE